MGPAADVCDDLVAQVARVDRDSVRPPQAEPGDPVQSTLKQRQSPAEYSMTVKCDTRRMSGTAAFTTHRYNVSLSCGPSIRLALHAALGRHQGLMRVYLIAARRAWINL